MDFIALPPEVTSALIHSGPGAELLVGVAAEIMLAAAFVYAPPLQALLGTAALPATDLLMLVPYPFVVWGADEVWRYLLRRSDLRWQHRTAPIQPRESPAQAVGSRE